MTIASRQKTVILQYFAAIMCSVSLSIIFSHGCAKYAKYVPDPVKDIDQWAKNFEQQKSFSYEYEMKTNFVSVRAFGDCVIGVGERLSGQWERGDGVQEFEYIGLGDIEYAKKGIDWEKAPRGEESDVFTQIKRLLSFDNFEYEGFDDGFFYRFRANVPFLAPDRRKEMIGIMKISDDDYLPEFMWAGLPDSSIYWTAQIFDRNTYKDVKIPIKEYREYIVSYAAQTGDDIYGKIESRLDLVNVDYRMRSAGQGLLISLPDQYRIEDVDKMLRTGGLSVYGVVQSGKAATRTAYLKDDLHAPVFLSDLLFTGVLVRDAEINFDQRSTPYIALRLREGRTMPHMIAFEVDSVLIATATLDTLYKMDRIKVYPDMQYREMEILRAYIKQPLGALRISPAGGENP
jgi:hypothetical protein